MVAEGLEVFITFPDTAKMPENAKIKSVRPFKKGVLVSFEGIEDLDSAERLRGAMLEVAEEDLHPLPDGNYYLRHLIGLQVKSRKGEDLGTIEEILQGPANDVYVAKMPGGEEILIPALLKVIKEVDLEEGILTVDRDGSW